VRVPSIVQQLNAEPGRCPDLNPNGHPNTRPTDHKRVH